MGEEKESQSQALFQPCGPVVSGPFSHLIPGGLKARSTVARQRCSRWYSAGLLAGYSEGEGVCPRPAAGSQ